MAKNFSSTERSEDCVHGDAWRVAKRFSSSRVGQRHNFSISITCLTNSGRAAWQEEEEDTRKEFSIVLTHQEQAILYFQSLQGHSGRSLIDTSTVNTSDVQSIHIPSPIQDSKREDRILVGADRRYSFTVLNPMNT